MAKSKKKDGPNIAGAALGATFGGAIGAGAGKVKAIKDVIRTDVTRAHGNWHYSDLKQQKTKAQNKVWEMNLFNKLRGIADRYQFNIDPKFKSRMNYYRQQMKTPMPNSKLTIAKWAVPPALAGGIVGSFVEKKAELKGEDSMTKAEQIMMKVAHNVRHPHNHNDPLSHGYEGGYGQTEGRGEGDSNMWGEAEVGSKRIKDLKTTSVKSKVNKILGVEDKSGPRDNPEGTYQPKADPYDHGRVSHIDKGKDVNIRHIVNAISTYNEADKNLDKSMGEDKHLSTYDDYDAAGKRDEYIIGTRKDDRSAKEKTQDALNKANRKIPTIEAMDKKKADDLQREKAEKYDALMKEQKKEGSYKAYNLFNKLKERN